jgi:hypothetical protein
MMPVRRQRMKLTLLHRLGCTANRERCCDSLVVAGSTCVAHTEHSRTPSRKFSISISYSLSAQAYTSKYRESEERKNREKRGSVEQDRKVPCVAVQRWSAGRLEECLCMAVQVSAQAMHCRAGHTRPFRAPSLPGGAAAWSWPDHLVTRVPLTSRGVGSRANKDIARGDAT